MRARCAVVIAMAVTAIAAMPAAGATVRFGPRLTTTPKLDTANGARSHTGSATGPERAIPPFPHAAEDLSVWATRIKRGSAAARSGGQVTAVRIEGCAVKDTTAPSQLSQGTPVNTIEFQTLHRTGASRTVTATAGTFLEPFCSNSAHPARGRINTSTITTFHPIHECLARGDEVDLHDIGGFIPASSGGGPWYPQGIPLDVIARVAGSSMASYVGLSGVYGPGSPSGAAFGFVRETGEELEMQIVEGTGDDAYGLCPGGHANEPSTSNRVICDYGHRGRHHPQCDGSGRPIGGPRRTVSAASS